jgi:hypothetical protein
LPGCPRLQMSTLVLKIIACLAMLSDHVGYFARYGFSEYENILRGFGRVAFPIYCYLIAFGFRKTSNKYKYLLRLLVLGIISEVPFHYCFYGEVSFAFENVYYTLSLGLLSLILFDLMLKSGGPKYLALLPVVLASFTAQHLGTDYGADGVLLIFFFYLAGSNKLALSVSGLVFAARKYIFAAGNGFWSSLVGSRPFSLTVRPWEQLQLLAALALVPILLCNSKRGYNPKSPVVQKVIQYSFYFFYPVHILILGLIFRNFIIK